VSSRRHAHNDGRPRAGRRLRFRFNSRSARALSDARVPAERGVVRLLSWRIFLAHGNHLT